MQGEIELAVANRKLSLLEGEYEVENAKLASTLEKLEETTVAATECDR